MKERLRLTWIACEGLLFDHPMDAAGRTGGFNVDSVQELHGG